MSAGLLQDILARSSMWRSRRSFSMGSSVGSMWAAEIRRAKAEGKGQCKEIATTRTGAQEAHVVDVHRWIKQRSLTQR